MFIFKLIYFETFDLKLSTIQRFGRPKAARSIGNISNVARKVRCRLNTGYCFIADYNGLISMGQKMTRQLKAVNTPLSKDTRAHVCLIEVLRTVALLVGSDFLDTLLFHLVLGRTHLSGTLSLSLQVSPCGLARRANYLLARCFTLHLVTCAGALGKTKRQSSG